MICERPVARAGEMTYQHAETCARCKGSGTQNSMIHGWPENCSLCLGSGLLAIYLDDNGEAVMRPVRFDRG